MLQERNISAQIFNIQKFSIHDGPGIRTTVFFAGCPLNCKWCANPESQSIHLNRSWAAHQIKKMTVDEVLEECLQDAPFYEESEGGVTFSGGEPLLHSSFAQELTHKLHSYKIPVAIETTGCVKRSTFETALSWADFVLYDVKHYSETAHLSGTGQSQDLILKNLSLTVKKAKDFLVRIPIIPNFNDAIEDARLFANMLKVYEVPRVQLLPFHQLGESKYAKLNLNYAYKDVPILHKEELVTFQQQLCNQGIDAFFD